MSRVRKALRIYLTVFAAIWMVALVAVFIQGQILHKIYPYNTLFGDCVGHFMDFTIFDARFSAWNHHTDKFFTLPGFAFTYPAPLLVFFLAYWKFTAHPLAFYLATVGIFVLLAAAVLGTRRRSLHIPVGLTLVGAYPLMFLFERANMEGLVWISLVLGTIAFAKRWYTAAAICFGLAASMKIFPGALLLLLVSKRRYRDFAVGIGFALSANVAALAIAGPNLRRALQGILGGFDFFRSYEILQYHSAAIGFDHSLFACLKRAVHLAVHSATRANGLLPSLYLPYGIAVSVAFAVFYVARLRKLPVLNQLFALTACSIMLPFVSYDYTLVHLYTPWAAFLLFLTGDVARGRVTFSLRKMIWFLVPCAVLFAPLSWVLLHNTGGGGHIKAIALLVLTGAAAVFPMPSSLFGELATARQKEVVLNRLVILEKEPVHSLS